LLGQSEVSDRYPAITRHTKTTNDYRNQLSPATTANSFWINYGWIEDSLKGGLSILNENYLFPDSTVKVLFGTSYGAPWMHCISDVLDVKDPDFKTYKNFNFNEFTTYSIDSLSIEYGYERHSPAGIRDTLLFYLFNDVPPGNLKTGHWSGATGWNTNFGVDTLAVKIPVYDHVHNAPIASGMNVFKVVLGPSDTALTYLKFKALKTNSFVVPQGHLAAVAVSFKPGYSYHSGDSLEKKGNIFSYASYEENGAGTFPSYKKYYWNSSAIIPTSVRYNDDKLGWDSSFVPTYLYTAPFNTERHQIYYKVTSLNTGIREADTSPSGMHLGQNHPNPFNRTSVINYETSIAGRIRLEVYDISGRVVLVLDEGNKLPGNYSLSIDAVNLKQGVYFYSMQVNGKTEQTRKMIVSN
jgi:hypothetical protein